MKIAVISATKVSIGPVDLAAKRYPDLELFHLMDEGMSYLGKKEGKISQTNMDRMKRLIGSSEELGVDGILLSCTIFSPFIDELEAYADVPLVAADIGVFEKAASLYNHIGAVVTFAPTLKSVSWVVERCRKRVNPDFDAELILSEEAFAAAAAGDDEAHNRAIWKAVTSFSDKEAVVLSQMSQMRALPLFDTYPVPVLASPPVSLGLLIERITGKEID